MSEVATWDSRIPYGVQVQVPDTVLPIQLHANCLVKAAQDGPHVWAPATPVGDPEEAHDS